MAVMKRRIYWAAPLHNEEDRERNLKFANMLRARGHLVYMPQEHGLWEDFPDPKAARPHLFKLDLEAMQVADCCIAYAGDRAPSEGMLWEMGYMTGIAKPVYLLNDKGWDYNLMPEFGSTRMFDDFEKLYTHLVNEGFLDYDEAHEEGEVEEDEDEDDDYDDDFYDDYEDEYDDYAGLDDDDEEFDDEEDIYE